MSDSLLDLLRPHISSSSPDHADLSSANTVVSKYLSRLPKLDLNALQTSEPQSLAQASHSNLLALQALASRSTKSLISSSDHLSKLGNALPSVATYATGIRDGVGNLDKQAVTFSEKYSRSADTPSQILERRKRALLLARNAERVGDMLELPTLLSSAVNSAATGASGPNTSGSALSTTTTYNAALDLQGHVKRLAALHPESEVVQSIGVAASGAMREMTVSLIHTLRSPNLKLAGGMRTIGWLRRVAPGLVSEVQANPDTRNSALVGTGEEEGSLGALFLVCRLANLENTLDALEPLRVLADQETQSRKASKAAVSGHQTERYLKRFIELFREQSFNIVSMFRSIFPAEEEANQDQDLGLDFNKMGLGNGRQTDAIQDQAETLPSAMSTFTLHLVSSILLPTLHDYLPNISDRSARESLLTQALYCAGSLGRLGGDFSLLLVDLYDDNESNDSDDDENAHDDKIAEWVEVMKKHRIQAARLESLASTSTGFGSLKAQARDAVAA